MCQSIENNIFDTIEEAVFWSATLLKIKNDGVTHIPSKGHLPRPFEPIDIMLPLWRLIRSGRIDKNCETIIMKYGSKGRKPLKSNTKDYNLWNFALTHLEPMLIKKNIIRKKRGNNND